MDQADCVLSTPPLNTSAITPPALTESDQDTRARNLAAQERRRQRALWRLAKLREKARAEIEWYLGAENYVKNLLWLGFTEDDVAHGGSDRLVDELVFWGDEDAIVERLRAHHAAGADHVAIHPVRDEHDPLGVETFTRLAAHLA